MLDLLCFETDPTSQNMPLGCSIATPMRLKTRQSSVTPILTEHRGSTVAMAGRSVKLRDVLMSIKGDYCLGCMFPCHWDS